MKTYAIDGEKYFQQHTDKLCVEHLKTLRTQWFENNPMKMGKKILTLNQRRDHV